jgi:hypothetical protein
MPTAHTGRAVTASTGVNLGGQLLALAEEALAASDRSGVYAVAAWTAYADNVRAAVNEIRALECADLLFLHGAKLREIADAVRDVSGRDLTHQAVAEWITRYGPKQYATVRKHSDGTHTLSFVPVMGMVQTRREIAARSNAGQRIAPATWKIDPDTTVDATQLWNRIGDRYA